MAITEEPNITVEEIEAEILAILEDCQRQGLTREEMREVFSPLGLPEVKQAGTVKRPKVAGDKGKKRRSSVNSSTSTTPEATWKRTLLYIGIVAVAGAIALHFYEEELKSIRFHALAVARIVLIKV